MYYCDSFRFFALFTVYFFGKGSELGPEGVYRYYSTQRPVDIGTYPKPPDNQPLSIVNYDDDRRRPVADGRLMAWGELTYLHCIRPA